MRQIGRRFHHWTPSKKRGDFCRQSLQVQPQNKAKLRLGRKLRTGNLPRTRVDSQICHLRVLIGYGVLLSGSASTLLIEKFYGMRLSRVLYYLPAANCQSRIHKIGKILILEFLVHGTHPCTIGIEFVSGMVGVRASHSQPPIRLTLR
jgi:hypothetical protein